MTFSFSLLFTDSLIFALPEDKALEEEIIREFRIGNEIFGGFKFETDTEVHHFCTLSPKNYAYKTAGNSENGPQEVTKVRGFCLTNQTAKATLNHDAMKDLLLKSLDGVKDSVEVKNFSFKLDPTTQTVRTQPITKVYRNNILDQPKRWLPPNKEDQDAMLTTYPYGTTSTAFADLLPQSSSSSPQ